MARKEKRYHYIYKTTNVLNGKYYIGMHSTNDLDDGYMGSGKRLRFSLNYHGKNNHKVEILEYCENRTELKNRERDIVNEELLNEDLCMNLVLGGDEGPLNKKDRVAKAKKANKIRNDKYKNDPEFREMLREKLSKGIKRSYDNGRKGMNHFSWKGKTRTDEVKRKMSESSKGMGKGEKNSQYGTCWITDGENNKKMKKTDSIPEGWVLGKTTIKKELLLEIKKYYDEGNSYRKTSKKFNISTTAIRDNFKKYFK